MTVHTIATEPMKLVNVLLFDAVEGEWRIGHLRVVLEGVDPFYCACTVAEAADLLCEGVPVPVFADVSHWAQLPDPPALG